MLIDNTDFRFLPLSFYSLIIEIYVDLFLIAESYYHKPFALQQWNYQSPRITLMIVCLTSHEFDTDKAIYNCF